MLSSCRALFHACSTAYTVAEYILVCYDATSLYAMMQHPCMLEKIYDANVCSWHSSNLIWRVHGWKVDQTEYKSLHLHCKATIGSWMRAKIASGLHAEMPSTTQAGHMQVELQQTHTTGKCWKGASRLMIVQQICGIVLLTRDSRNTKFERGKACSLLFLWLAMASIHPAH